MPPIDEIVRALIARGRIPAGSSAHPLSGGNQDRRATLTRTSWKAHAANGSAVKLTIGPGLAELAQRHRAAVEACAGLVPALAFIESVGDVDVLAEAFVDGSAIDTPDGDGTCDPRRYRSGLSRVRGCLAASERPSTAAARCNEWRRWTEHLLASDAFLAAEKRELSQVILPGLQRHLCRGPSVTRWSNGDFRPGNILVDTKGHPWLIDHEYGCRTHFFSEDEIRFTVFTPEARHQPDLLPSAVADDIGWHLYFWLRQFQLEADNNNATYLARFGALRKGLIRRLAENLLGVDLNNWSVAALQVDFALEDVRWLQHEEMVLFVSGWAYAAAASGIECFVLASTDSPPTTLLPGARPDVQSHFGDSPATRVSGFSGRRLATEADTSFTIAMVTNEGWLLPLRTFKVADQMGRGPSTGHYAAWARSHGNVPPVTVVPGASNALISILVPVYNTPPSFLHACLESVRAQSHPTWELLLIDDASSRADVRPLLEEAAKDPRVSVIYRSANGGIARATNDALSKAKGDYFVLLDHDDVLRPEALGMLTAVIQGDPSLDAIYTDEDKITEDGRRVFPFLKPAFSPEFLRGVMYPGHLLCVRRTLALEIGGFDPSFDGVQDYEFFLRLSERTRRIHHLPAILYHWRRSPGSSALHGNVKGDMDSRQLAAVQAHLKRIGDPRQAEAAGGHRIRLRRSPSSAVISTQPLQTEAADAVSLLREAALSGTADVMVVVSDPSITVDEHTLHELAVLATRPDSGFVAPVLLSDEERILESGCTFAAGRLIPMMVNFDTDDDGYNGASLCNREVAAVSPLCAAVRRELVLAHASAQGQTWVQLTEALRSAGYNHRVNTSARVAVRRSGADHRHELVVPEGATDPYYHPSFRREPADYAFVGPAMARIEPTGFESFLDLSPPAILADGCLQFRGWCFHRAGQPVIVHVDVAGIQWQVAANLPRPDVAKAFDQPRIANCGFSLNLRLPAGHHTCTLVAVAGNGDRSPFFTGRIHVPITALLRRARDSAPDSLLACQLPVAPLHPPRGLNAPRRRNARGADSSWPRFSIVTPSYQHVRFLEQTIRGVLSQSVDGEYRVHDGGSKDGSVEMLRRLEQEKAASSGMRFTGWVSEPDFGQTDAILKAFAHTSGRPDDVMAWINSDDFHLPGAFAVVADFFARHPEVEVVYAHRLMVDEQSREIGRWHLPPHSPDVLRLYDFVPQETLFWRRRVWDRVGGLDRDYQFAMDWDLLLRFQAAGARIVRLPCFLACFRVHSAQKTSSQLAGTGQEELDTLRFRTFGRRVTPAELVRDPHLQTYLRTSARHDLWARAGYLGRVG